MIILNWFSIIFWFVAELIRAKSSFFFAHQIAFSFHGTAQLFKSKEKTYFTISRAIPPLTQFVSLFFAITFISSFAVVHVGLSRDFINILFRWIFNVTNEARRKLNDLIHLRSFGFNEWKYPSNLNLSWFAGVNLSF